MRAHKSTLKTWRSVYSKMLNKNADRLQIFAIINSTVMNIFVEKSFYNSMIVLVLALQSNRTNIRYRYIFIVRNLLKG